MIRLTKVDGTPHRLCFGVPIIPTTFNCGPTRIAGGHAPEEVAAGLLFERLCSSSARHYVSNATDGSQSSLSHSLCADGCGNTCQLAEAALRNLQEKGKT